MRYHLLAGMILVCLPMISGCGRTPSEVGVNRIAVYPGSRLTDTDSMGSMAGENISRLEAYTTRVWEFKSSATAKEIIAFYANKYPDADRDDMDSGDEEDVVTEFVFYPGDPRLDTEVSIAVYHNSYEIAETTKD